MDRTYQKLRSTTSALIHSNSILNNLWHHNSKIRESRLWRSNRTGVALLAWLFSPFTLGFAYTNLKKSVNVMNKNNLAYLADEVLFEKIDEHDVISFDLYDTLILRDVFRPSDLFKLIEIHQDAPGFFCERIRAEREADRKAKTLGRANSDLDEIYDLLNSPRGDSLLRTEIQLEYTLSSCNPFMKRVYDRAVEDEKTILITSDTFHKRGTIENILSHAGYDKYDHLFISSENGLSKYDGSIYPYIYKTLGITPGDLLHVGDNYRSDYLMAIKNKVSAHHYINARERNNNVLMSGSELFSSIHNGVVSNLFTEKRAPSFKIGASIFGPLYWQYVNWIREETEKDGVEKLFFLSRDGFLVKKAYKIIIGEDHPYSYLSRLTIRRALLAIQDVDPSNILTEDLYEISFSKVACSFIPHFDTFELRGTQFEGKLVGELKDSHRDFIELLQNNYGEYLNEQYDLLLAYLSSIGMTKADKVGLIDVGWNGSLQDCLQTIFSYETIPCRTFGYYIGILDKQTNRERAKKLNMRGFAFFLNRPEFGNELYERFFTAPHGSVVGYSDRNGEIIPLMQTNSTDTHNYSSYYYFENGVLCYLYKIKKYEKYFNDPIIQKDILRNIEKFVKQPKYDEIEAVMDFAFEDVFRDGYNINEYWPSSILYRTIYKYIQL